ncbi:MAG TPA: ACT domain-containing protein [Firmicutes bacterium]|nr:ACT domain-containing protein [Bacillota bacterium]
MKENGMVEELIALRGQISKIDQELLTLFAARMEVVQRVAEYKKHSGASVLDRRREGELLAELEGCRRVFIETLLRLSRVRQYDLLLDQDPKWRLGEELNSAPRQLPAVRTVAVSDTHQGHCIQAAARLFPSTTVVPVSSFAAVIGQVLEKNADAAILPLADCTEGTVAEIYTLLAENALYIQAALNLSTNKQTRLIAVGPTLILPPQAGQVSLLLQTPDEVGALAAVLNIFADLGINLNKIESIPVPNSPGDCRFYLDFWAPSASREVKRALYQLEHEFPRFSFLGWYEVQNGAGPVS